MPTRTSVLQTQRMRRESLAAGLVVAVGLVALLGSCGEPSNDRLAPGARERPAADLRVILRSQGARGPARVERVRCARVGDDAREHSCRRLGRLRPEDLDPVPARTACAQVYAGRATARVTGELRGVPVAASFDLTDACEVARWRRNAALLGPPPGKGAPSLNP